MSVVTVAKSLAGVKGTGWRENKADERDRIFKPHLPLAPGRMQLAKPVTSVRVEGSRRSLGLAPLRECVPPRFNQGATSSCVAQAIAGAVATREMHVSQQMERTKARNDLFSSSLHGQLSRRALYSLARATHGDERNDGGTYIRAALQELRRHGCPLEPLFPFSETRINAKVPLNLLHTGYAFAEIEYEAIVAAGDDKLEQIRLALREGYPVVFGATVNRSFQRYRGGIYSPPASGDVVAGGHAMYLVALEDDCATLVNSWGSWGEDGFARVDLEWVKRAFRDLTIMKNWRRVRAAEKELQHAA